MYDLPKEIQEIIYSYDSTYREKYDQCIRHINKASQKKFKIKFAEWNKVYFSVKTCFWWKKEKYIIWRQAPISIFGHYFLLFVYLDLVWNLDYSKILALKNKFCNCQLCNKTYILHIKEKITFMNVHDSIVENQKVS